MRKRLTLAFDKDLLRAAREVALERKTPLNQLMRDFLAQLVRDEKEKKIADRLKRQS